MIYYCSLFTDEVELLHARLHEWKNVPDVRHVLLEHAVTFQGNPKPYNLDALITEETGYLFDGFALLLGNYDTLAGYNAWFREGQARDDLGGLLRKFDVEPDDLIIVSDADEIVRASAVDVILDRCMAGPVQFPCVQHYYDMTHVVAGRVDARPKAAFWRDVSDKPLRWLCDDRYLPEIANAAWHFSMLGGAQRVYEKLLAFSHTELQDVEGWVTLDNVRRLIAEGRDVVPPPNDRELERVPLEGPTWLLAELALGRWPHLLDATAE